MNMQRKKVGFLVHPRGMNDFLIKFPYLKILPRKFLEVITKKHGPVIASKITGLRDVHGESVEGYVIGITLTAKQMMEDRDLALKKIKEAVIFARDNGVGVIGLGALTASFSRGGLDVSDIEGIGVTTGRAYTVHSITSYFKSISEDVNLNIQGIKVGIVGAAGSIGSACFFQLLELGVRSFILVDTEKKLLWMKKYAESALGGKDKSIQMTHKISEIVTCDVIIAATNAPEAIIHSDDLKNGAIVINDAQPSDIHPDVLKRDDVIVVEGGVVTSDSIKPNFKFGLARNEDSFSCMAEVLILGHNNMFKNYAIGELDTMLVSDIEKLGKTLDIRISEYQNDNGIIPRSQIENIKKIIHNRY